VRRSGRAVLGGTFDRLHIGHESLLETAFRVGREVGVGITSERYLADHPKPDGAPLQTYAVRRRHLTAWLRRHHPDRSWKVVALDEPFGGSVAPGVGVLVVSADTVDGGAAVNDERRRRGLPPVPIVVVPLALADDLSPVASRRIRAGTIDRNGRRRSPIRVELRTSVPSDARAAGRAIRAAFPQAVVVPRPAGARSLSTKSPPRPSRRAVPSAELSVTVARWHDGGWTVTERSPYVTLLPVRIRGRRPSQLARGLRSLLRPSTGRGPT